MPWKPGDAKKKTKAASTPAKEKKWAATANSVRGKSGDDAKAIKIANTVVKKHPAKKKKG